jgi:hypothetical protein
MTEYYISEGNFITKNPLKKELQGQPTWLPASPTITRRGSQD